jgi:hypothetical protein
MKANYELFMLFLMFGVAQCDNDDGNNNNPDQPDNVVIISENIVVPTGWSGDSVYIIKSYDFYIESTLSIQPGTIIKFHPAEGPYLMLGGSGKIIAQGTSSKPIVFTSFKDDEHGGDNNKDGQNTQPAAKDWGGINTNGCDGSVFKYCCFYYGGNDLYNATFTLFGDNTRIEYCTFANNDGSYDHVGVLDASDGGHGTIIKNNIFYNNKRPLTISSMFDMDDSNIFHDPANPAQTNHLNGIFVDMEYSITEERQWAETEVAFVIDGYQRYIDHGGSLVLADNVVIKFQESGELWLEEGAGQLINHDGPGVYFTSYRDDTRKGDTNGDGNASSPAHGDWSGIYDNSLSIPSPYFYNWGNIMYDSY